MTPHLRDFRDIPGDVVDFVGQEPGFESWDDEQVRDLALSVPICWVVGVWELLAEG